MKQPKNAKAFRLNDDLAVILRSGTKQTTLKTAHQCS
jgi:hypothetical protein